MNIPSPKAPAIIALDYDDRQARVGRRVARRQDPARPVVHAGGRHDRRRACRSCTARATAGCAATRRRPARSSGSSTPIPKDSVWPKTRNEVIATPVIFENVVYIANGQDPEHGEGVGHLYAIDATKRGDITQDRAALALRQDPPLDLDGVDQGRPHLLPGLQRVPALPRRQDRQADLDARHVRRDVELDDGGRRQGVSRRRGRRRRRHAARPREEDSRRERTWAARSTRRSSPPTA